MINGVMRENRAKDIQNTLLSITVAAQRALERSGKDSTIYAACRDIQDAIRALRAMNLS